MTKLIRGIRGNRWCEGMIVRSFLIASHITSIAFLLSLTLTPLFLAKLTYAFSYTHHRKESGGKRVNSWSLASPHLSATVSVSYHCTLFHSHHRLFSFGTCLNSSNRAIRSCITSVLRCHLQHLLTHDHYHSVTATNTCLSLTQNTLSIAFATVGFVRTHLASSKVTRLPSLHVSTTSHCCYLLVRATTMPLPLPCLCRLPHLSRIRSISLLFSHLSRPSPSHLWASCQQSCSWH